MGNEYTTRLQKRLPAVGDENWDDEWHDNEKIDDVVMGALLTANRVISGGTVTLGTGLVPGYAAMEVLVAGVVYDIAGGSIAATAAVAGQELANWLYISSAGVVTISTTPPNGDYVPLALVDTSDTAVIRIADLRPIDQLRTTKIASFDNGFPLIAFGDSITTGSGASDVAHGYAAIFADLRGRLLNKAVNATQCSEHAFAAYCQEVQAGLRSFVLTGYNDMRAMGSDTAKQGVYKDQLQAMLAFLAIPNDQKIYGQDSRVTYANIANWSLPASTVYKAEMLRTSTVLNEKATVKVKGTTVIVGSTMAAAGAGTFEIRIDGVLVKSATTAMGYTSVAGGLYAPRVFIFSGLEDTEHTVEFKITSSGSIVYFDWCAGNKWTETTMLPEVFVGNCLKMNAAGYAIGSPTWDKGSDAAVIQFNAIIADVISVLQGCGLRIINVAANTFYDPATADVNADNVHPSDAGHAKIAAAFIVRDKAVKVSINFTPVWNKVAPSLLTNGWVNFGSGGENAQYCKDVMGWVHLRGLIRNGTLGLSAFTLPVGFRPAAPNLFMRVSSNDTSGQVKITSAGEVIPHLGSNLWFQLEPISFYVG